MSASYPGASALTVSQAVATPIEQELNGTPGMLYMESSSTNTGSFSATVTFDISVNPDLAAVEIQNRVKQAEARLPAEVVQNGISVEKQASNQLMTVCLLSSDDKFDEIYLSNFATLNVVDILRRIPGVGGVSNVGSRYYAMQIWVQPDKAGQFRCNRSGLAERTEGPEPRIGRRRARPAAHRRCGYFHPHLHAGQALFRGGVRRTSSYAPTRTVR